MRSMVRLVWLAAALLPGAASAVTVEAVGPRPQAVLDQAQLLDAQAEAEIASIAAGIRRDRGADLVVVTLDSADGPEPHAYAVALFRRWKLGDATRDDGVLLMVAMEQRAVELILGDGIDNDAQVATAQRIVDDRMLPLLRARDPQGALLGGSRAVAGELFGLIALDADAQPVETATPVAPVADVPAAASAREAPASDEVPWAGLAILAALGAFMLGLVVLGFKVVASVVRRLSTPNCPRCKVAMQRLDEAADDAHLDAGERTEEKLKSVNYDIWICPTCTHAEKRRHGTWFSKYRKCDHCSVVASSSTHRTLQSATRYSTGLEEVTTECAHCGSRDVGTRVTARLPPPSSSSSSGGGSTSGRGGSGRW